MTIEAIKDKEDLQFEFHDYIYWQKIDQLKELLTNHADDIEIDALNSEDITELAYAIMEGHVDTFHLLIEFGADINKAYSPVEDHAIFSCRDKEVLKCLLDLGFDLTIKDENDEDLYTVFFDEEEYGLASIVKSYMDVKPLQNTQDETIQIKFYEFLMLEDSNALELLLKEHTSSIDVCKSLDNYASPLGIAIRNDNLKLCKLLIKYGADVKSIYGGRYNALFDCQNIAVFDYIISQKDFPFMHCYSGTGVLLFAFVIERRDQGFLQSVRQWGYKDYKELFDVYDKTGSIPESCYYIGEEE